MPPAWALADAEKQRELAARRDRDIQERIELEKAARARANANATKSAEEHTPAAAAATTTAAGPKRRTVVPEPDVEEPPSVWSADLNALGWKGYSKSSPTAMRLRHDFQHNGLDGGNFEHVNGALIAAGDQTEVARAAALFDRDGFVAVTDVLSVSQLMLLRSGCEDAIRQIVAALGVKGNRGDHRFSFGGASSTNSWAHRPEWTQLIDLPAITPILRATLGPGYTCRSVGGDFCLPGCLKYQELHSDMGKSRMEYRGDQRDNREIPCGWIAVNFLPQAFTKLNGPIRQIRGATQTSKLPIPSLLDESEASKLSALTPLPAGCAIVRDIRAWHGGTPNVSDEVRAIPNAEFYAEWVNLKPRVSMPHSLWESLPSDDARARCRKIKAMPGQRIKPHIGRHR